MKQLTKIKNRQKSKYYIISTDFTKKILAQNPPEPLKNIEITPSNTL